MQPSVFRALEFDRVRDALASLTRTPVGHARASRLTPATEAEAVTAALALTAEAVAFVGNDGSLDLVAPADFMQTMSVLEIADEPLDPLPLLGLARFFQSLDAVIASVERSAGANGRRLLAGVAARAASFEAEARAVTKSIDPSGEVNDGASAALRDIRDALRRQRSKLRGSLDALTRARENAKYLQDQIVADRNGRYVLVVRSEHRDAIPGIVHGTSASGASVYVEPLASVSLNNEIVTLVERERAEVQRILLTLTNAFRVRAGELHASIDAGAELDELAAKADLAHRVDGVAPEVTTDGRFELRGARHPLLIPALSDLLRVDDDRRDAARTVSSPVASDLMIVPPAQVLVISGPNTGGKTVALKAFGLLALMAQAGLFIPVEKGSRLTPFRTVFADIGDEQSISASLSTFSSHIRNIVSIDRDLDLPALVLLDEVGGGTDPAEGGALAAALLEHFRRRGAMIVVTTHDEALKSYAATTAGVVGAGFGFQPNTYAPTYRLRYGTPGRSLALEIAAGLGVPPDVISEARARQSGRESLLAAHLSKIDTERASLDAERDALTKAQRDVALERQRLIERESRLTEREATIKQRLDERLNDKLRDAKAEVDRIVQALKEKSEGLAARADERRAPRLSTGELGGLRAEARAALTAVSHTIGQETQDDAGAALAEPPDIGDRVYLRLLRTEGIVRALSGNNADVDVRGKRLRVKVSDLSSPASQTSAPERTARSVRLDTAPRPAGASRELVLVGATIDEAVTRAEKFLDDALLSDERRLRIVHGHGTGRLREAIRKFLREHPLVAKVEPAPDHEGGAAATIVELKD